MQPITLSELPIVAMTRSDRVLDLCLQKLQSPLHSSESKTNSQSDFKPAVLNNLFDMGNHQLRHEDFQSALNQHWRKHTVGYKLDCLTTITERYLQFQGDHFAVKHNLETQYQAIINAIHPSLLIAAGFNQLHQQQQLNYGALPTLLNNQCPLGFPPSDTTTTYADNHVHFGGVHGCEVLTRLLFLDVNSNSFKNIKLPRVPEFTLINNQHYSPQKLVSLYRLLFNAFSEHVFNQRHSLQPHSQQPSSLQEVANLSKDIQKVLLTNHMTANKNLAYNFNKTNKKPQSDNQLALHTMVNGFIDGQHHLALIPLISALLNQVNQPQNQQIYLISLALIQLINILRSYVVMSGVGLSQFVEFFDSSVRKYQRSESDQEAVNWLINNNNIVSIKRGPIKDIEQLKPMATSVIDNNQQLHQHSALSSDDLLKHYDICLHFSRAKNTKDNEKQKQHHAIKQGQELYQTLCSQKRQTLYLSTKQKLQSQPQAKLFLQQTVRGFDVAGNENHHRIEVFAPILRYLREKPIQYQNEKGQIELNRRRYLSIHAGEDYNHLISGLRHIDETITYCNMEQSDRIGHALALGVYPKHWAKRQQQTYVSIEEDLWNIVWLLHHSKKLAVKYQPALKVIPLFEMQLQQLQSQYFTQTFEFGLLFAYWQNRANAKLPHSQQSPHLPDHKYWIQSATTIEQQQQFTIIDNQLKKLPTTTIEIILDDPTGHHQHKSNGNTRHLCDNELDFYQLLQDVLMTDYDQRGITIEACPSSNISLGRFEHYHQHPIFRWFPPDEKMFETHHLDPFKIRNKGEVSVCVNTDDPGIFPTNIEQEYRLLKDAAQKHYGCSSQTVYIWLERLRKNALRVFNH